MREEKEIEQAQESDINRTHSKNRASETGIERHRDGITGERGGEKRGRGRRERVSEE